MSVEAAIPPETRSIKVDGMSCASCVAHVEKAIRSVPGVGDVSVNLATGRATVKLEPNSSDEVVKAIVAAGYEAEWIDDDSPKKSSHEEQVDHHERAWRRRAIVGTVLWLPVESLHWILKFAGVHLHGVNWMTWLSVAASAVAMIFVGRGFFVSAWKALRRGTTNMDSLISLGAGTAFVYSSAALAGHLLFGWTLPHLYFMESAALLALISVGHWLEHRARGRART